MSEQNTNEFNETPEISGEETLNSTKPVNEPAFDTTEEIPAVTPQATAQGAYTPNVGYQTVPQQRPQPQQTYTPFPAYQPQGSYYSAPNPPPKPQTKKKKKGERSVGFYATIISICLVVGVCSGFAGTFLYTKFFGTGGVASGGNVEGDIVINQSVNDPTADVKEDSLTEIIDDISHSVVEIRTEQVSYGYFIGNYVSEGAGSGVIISDDGYIITNNHVIEGADSLTVRTKSGEEYEAVLVGTDPQTDIAVIKIEAEGLEEATVGSSKDLKVGQRAIAIGNPLGELGGTVTIGYISALDREVSIDNVKMSLLQTDAAINPGNSGGGLFDVDGRLIGVVNAKSTGSDIEGLGFAIPIDTAFSIATDLMKNGHVSGRPGLGIQASEVTASNYSQFRGTELEEYITDFGMYVVSDERGNFKFGDRIVALNKTTVSSSAELSSALNALKVGDTVTVLVSRNKKLIEVEVELIELNS